MDNHILKLAKKNDNLKNGLKYKKMTKWQWYWLKYNNKILTKQVEMIWKG